MKSLRGLRSNIKCTNIFIIGSHKKREKGLEKIFEEIPAEKVPDMGMETVTHVQRAQRLPGRINTRRNTQDSQSSNRQKLKTKKILTATRKNRQIAYKGTPIRL